MIFTSNPFVDIRIVQEAGESNRLAPERHHLERLEFQRRSADRL